MNTIEDYINSLHRFQDQFKFNSPYNALIDSTPSLKNLNSLVNNIPSFPREIYNPIFQTSEFMKSIQNISAPLSQSLLNISASQLAISSSMNLLSDNLVLKGFDGFQGLNIVLTKATSNYISDLAMENEWEDIPILEKANESLALITDELIESLHSARKDIQELNKSFILILEELKQKTKNEKTHLYINYLISIFSIFLSLIPFILPNNDQTNTVIKDELKIEIDKATQNILDALEEKFLPDTTKKIACVSTPLYKNNKTSSQKICVIKKGQEVYLIEVRKKFVLVAYRDSASDIYKAGFALKKHFD